MIWLFKQIKNWFAFPEYRDSLAALVVYLPVGDLESLLMWAKKWLPYRYDTDTGEENGKYDPLQNYNGADLTIKAKRADCESIAAVFSEVIRWWKGWESWHVCFVFTRTYNKYEAHDVCFFKRPDGSMGWIDGQVYEGGYNAFKQHYDLIGWDICDWYIVNDMGIKT